VGMCSTSCDLQTFRDEKRSQCMPRKAKNQACEKGQCVDGFTCYKQKCLPACYSMKPSGFAGTDTDYECTDEAAECVTINEQGLYGACVPNTKGQVALRTKRHHVKQDDDKKFGDAQHPIQAPLVPAQPKPIVGPINKPAVPEPDVEPVVHDPYDSGTTVETFRKRPASTPVISRPVVQETQSSNTAGGGSQSKIQSLLANPVAIGVSVGVLALIIILIVAIWVYCVRRRRNARKQKTLSAEGPVPPNDNTPHPEAPVDVSYSIYNNETPVMGDPPSYHESVASLGLPAPSVASASGKSKS